MELIKERNCLVEKNLGLVHYNVQKKGVKDANEYDELCSIGIMGLIKAANTFDSTKGITFATYASKCIDNEIFMHYRKEKKYKNNLSLDDSIAIDIDGKKLFLEDIIEHPESNFVENLVKKDEFTRIVSIILNYLSSKTRLVLLYRIAGLSQKEIGKRIKISQSYISRLERKAITEIRDLVKEPICYKQVFVFSIVKQTYYINFFTKDVEDFNSVFNNITSVECLTEFKFDRNRNRATISVIPELESFALIAEIIQKIGDYGIKCFPANEELFEDAI